MPNYSIGLQMYTLRDLTAEDFVGTLREVAAIGYQGVEFAGYGGMSAESLKALLDELGLAAIGSHVAYDRMLAATDEEITYMKTIGGRYIAIPILSEEHYATPAAWQQVSRNLAEIGQKCRAEGIQLLYHNHEFEFTEQFEGKPILDILFESVTPELLAVELDTCWAYAAGYDPMAYIAKYKDRLPLVHFKDYREVDGKKLTVELGAGVVPLMQIAESSAQSNCEWLIVEQDVCTNPPLESVRTSFQWIQKNLTL